MDEVEEAGLRAFALHVGAADGAPVWVERGGVRVDVERVVVRWREEERIGFRARLTDASDVLLYYVPELDLWSGVVMLPGDVAGVRPGVSVGEPERAHE